MYNKRKERSTAQDIKNPKCKILSLSYFKILQSLIPSASIRQEGTLCIPWNDLLGTKCHWNAPLIIPFVRFAAQYARHRYSTTKKNSMFSILDATKSWLFHHTHAHTHVTHRTCFAIFVYDTPRRAASPGNEPGRCAVQLQQPMKRLRNSTDESKKQQRKRHKRGEISTAAAVVDSSRSFDPRDLRANQKPRRAAWGLIEGEPARSQGL